MARKRLTSLLLVAALAATTVLGAGCGTSSSDSESGSASNAESGTEDENAAAEDGTESGSSTSSEEFIYAGQTGGGDDEYMGDPCDVYYLDASVQNPDDYTDIVGFTLTVNYNKHGNYGGGAEDDSFQCGMILVSYGEQNPDDYNFTYDNGQTPEFDLSTETLTSFGFGEAGWLISMVFSSSVEGDTAVTDGDQVTLTYEGTTAIFTDDCSEITLVNYLGDLEYVSVEWILGTPETVEEVEWDTVETIEYNDIATVDDSVQNGNNYVNITVPDTGEDSYPVVLWIHGGGYITGDRTSCLLSDSKEYLLAQGYAFVSVEYTLTGTETDDDGNTVYTTAGMPQMLYDVKAAVRFLRANADTYNLNTDFIAVMGESAGAGLALLMATSNGLEDYEDLTMGNADYSSDVQACISICGPSYFADDAIGNMYAYLGSTYEDYSEEELEELAELWSPTELVNSKTPALYLGYSEADTTVVFSHAENMYAAASEYMDEEDITTAFYTDGGHVDRNIFDNYSAYYSYAEFLNTQLAKYIE